MKLTCKYSQDSRTLTLYFPEEFDTSTLASGAVTADILADDSVTTSKIVDAAVEAVKIATASITSEKVATAAIGSDHLQDALITTAKIADLAVDTDKLADLVITAGKLAAGCVTNDKIADGTIESTKLAPDTTAPGATSNLSADGAFEKIVLTWTNPSDGDIDYVEVYRNTSDDRSTASKIAEVKGNVYSDNVGTGVTRYYWVRAVDTSDNIGDWNASAGTSGTTAQIATSDLIDLAVTEAKIADAAIATAKIADGAITSPKVAGGAIGTAELSDTAVTTAKLANLAVDNSKLAALAVDAAKLADAAVETSKIADAAVGSAAIANAAIGTAHIADAAITNAKIERWVLGKSGTSFPADPIDGEVFYRTDLNISYRYDATNTTWIAVDYIADSGRLVDGIITSAKIVDAAVNNAKIADLAVNSAKIADAAVVEAKIGDAAIVEAKIADAAITNAKIADLAVTGAKIANATIDSAKISDLSADKITAGTIGAVSIKLGQDQINLDGANSLIEIKDKQATPVTRVKLGKLGTGDNDYGAQIYDSSGNLLVGETGLGTGVVDSAQIVDLAVGTAAIANGAVGTAKIADAAIIEAKIDDAAVTTAKIYDAAIVTAKIADLAVTDAKIGSISANKITTGYLDADRIAAGSLTADKINVTNLSAINADLGTITAGNITLDSSGFIRTAGKDNYADTTAGFFLGYDGDAYKWNIGNSTEYMKWSGSNLETTARIKAGASSINLANPLYSSYVTLASYTTENSSESTSYVTDHTFTDVATAANDNPNIDTQMKVSFDLKGDHGSFTWNDDPEIEECQDAHVTGYAQLYRGSTGGTLHGSYSENLGDSWETKTATWETTLSTETIIIKYKTEDAGGEGNCTLPKVYVKNRYVQRRLQYNKVVVPWD